MRLLLSLISSFSLVLLITSLTGCMVGPNFHPAPSPHPHAYTDKPLPKHTQASHSLGQAGKSQEYQYGENIGWRWWMVFESPEINLLVEQGIANNPTITAAYAALAQAQELVNVQIGNTLLPAIDASAMAQRQRITGATAGGHFPGSQFNLFNAGVSVSYTLDLWGGNRRAVESLLAQVDYQQFQLIAAYLTMASNIVTTVVTMASLQAQIEATKALIASQERQLKIFRGQYRLGAIALENVAAQETVLGQSRALLPPLERNLAQNHNALAVLVGVLPVTPLAFPRLENIHLPKDVPVSFPSFIVRQRPDVRAAEALVHAASAQIGVATANLLPQITLSGSYGWQSTIASNLFSPQNIVWNMAVQATQAIFHGGALIANRRAAVDAYQQSLAQYKQAVLQGFQNVADSLRAIETDARTLHETRYAELAAEQFYDLTRKQYQLGGTSYLSIIIAEQQYRQATIARIQAQATRYTNMVALFQSLGGGWWNRGWCVYEPLGVGEPACV